MNKKLKFVDVTNLKYKPSWLRENVDNPPECPNCGEFVMPKLYVKTLTCLHCHTTFDFKMKKGEIVPQYPGHEYLKLYGPVYDRIDILDREMYKTLMIERLSPTKIDVYMYETKFGCIFYTSRQISKAAELAGMYNNDEKARFLSQIRD